MVRFESLPGTQLTPALIGKGHILGVWWSKIEVIQVRYVYTIYIYRQVATGLGEVAEVAGVAVRPPDLFFRRGPSVRS